MRSKEMRGAANYEKPVLVFSIFLMKKFPEIKGQPVTEYLKKVKNTITGSKKPCRKISSSKAPKKTI